MSEILMTSSVLIVLLLILRQAFRKAIPCRVQYALWALVLVRLLVPVNLPAVDFSVLTAAQDVNTQVETQLDNREVYVLPLDRTPADTIPAAQDVQPGETVPTAESFGYPVLSDDGQTVESVEFTRGCDGNLKAISKLVAGMPVDKVVELLQGNTCGPKPTSCADQLTHGLREAQKLATA